MRTRIASALLAIPLLVFVLVTGGGILLTALTIVSVIALWEFYNTFKGTGIYPFYTVGMPAGVIINIIMGIYNEAALAYVIAVIIFCTLICFMVMIVQSRARILDLGITLIGLVYISLLMSMLFLIYSMEHGPVIIWLVFIVAWIGDTFAYFIGINFGRNKLCPEISPKKSVEGAMGGLLGSILGAIVFGIVVKKALGLETSLPGLASVGLIGGVMSQLGDLTASVLKRYANVKDFGNIMPGHGGVLDRFDSILFAVPVIYYIIEIGIPVIW